MVARAGANLPAIGGYNQVVVLDAIRRAPEGISRVELAEHTGLSAQTVTNVSRRLLHAGVIREGGTVVAGIGKPRTLLQLSPQGGFALGVHLDPSVVGIVLLDLAGDVLEHRRLDVDPTSGAQQTLGEIAREARAIVTKEGVGLRERMLGVGIAAPGPLLEPSGTVLNPPLMPKWDRIAVRELLSDAIELPVLLEKDVTAAVVGERWMAGSSRENFAFVYYGTGVGFGIALQNEVIRGASGNAGDVGGMMVGATDAGGPQRQFGDAVSPMSVVPRAIALGVPLEATPQRGGGFHLLDEFTALCAAAERGGRASALIDQMLDDLAASLVPVANLLDVASFVFGGPFWPPVARRALARLPRSFDASAHLVRAHPIAFEESAIGSDVAAIGAGCLVLDHAFSPRPARLLLAHRP